VDCARACETDNLRRWERDLNADGVLSSARTNIDREDLLKKSLYILGYAISGSCYKLVRIHVTGDG
jgi:hypothetical protein